MDQKALHQLVIDFTDAFNRDDLEGVLAYMTDDALYDEFNGGRAKGKSAIRAAFEPQFRGDFGKIRFHTEDLFVDAESGKAMIRWLCTLENGERYGGWRGLDILHIEDGMITEKHTYAKTARPDLVKLAK